jgi:hypothetical protein
LAWVRSYIGVTSYFTRGAECDRPPNLAFEIAHDGPY